MPLTQQPAGLLNSSRCLHCDCGSSRLNPPPAPADCRACRPGRAGCDGHCAVCRGGAAPTSPRAGGSRPPRPRTLPRPATARRAGPAHSRLLWGGLSLLLPAPVPGQVGSTVSSSSSSSRQGLQGGPTHGLNTSAGVSKRHSHHAAAADAVSTRLSCAPTRRPGPCPCSRVLVFTAGLLLRLLKTGVYRLEQASLMLLLDAFTGAPPAAAPRPLLHLLPIAACMLWWHSPHCAVYAAPARLPWPACLQWCATIPATRWCESTGGRQRRGRGLGSWPCWPASSPPSPAPLTDCDRTCASCATACRQAWPGPLPGTSLHC